MRFRSDPQVFLVNSWIPSNRLHQLRDRANSGGHRVEERGQGTVEDKGTSSGETGVEQELGARQGQGGARQGV